ncbi:MAG: DNA-deoxyinosine glycosylase [Comamonadaceae bacterium PBBC1]|nr:MAG: DNA-deoxyinosine glycosylase [Comamonadaceae bacterium PBBC1]
MTRPVLTESLASPRLQGLPPIVGPGTRVLVLGSFPSVKSLQLQQYYAHPQNHFWRIVQAVWPDAPWPTDKDYARRCQCLQALGVGVWDVYAECEREGSLDSAIRHAQLNDFPALFKRCPQLIDIAHNGGESFRHAKAVEKSLAQAGWAGQVSVHRLPSTSPANASWTFDQKLTAWRAVLNP